MARIAIVGSGPAGFYVADKLLKRNCALHLDMFEKSCFPYGLLRYGVAPDHPEIRSTTKSFADVLASPNFRFLGSVEIGKTNSLQDLSKHYDASIICSGANVSRMLNIPGEDLCFSSDSFIGWINGDPKYSSFEYNFEKVKDVAIIGTGNVAIDVARLLLLPLNYLKHSDISIKALRVLSKNSVRSVNVFGRRSLLDASFTIKEYRELVDHEFSIVHESRDLVEAQLLLQKSEFSRKTERLVNLILAAEKRKVPDSIDQQPKLVFNYNMKLQAIEKLPSGRLQLFFLHPIEGKILIESDMVMKCIGFQHADLEYTADNIFTCGWSQSLAKGNIAATLHSAYETVEKVLTHLSSKGVLPHTRNTWREQRDCISWSDWEKASFIEREEGEIRQKHAEKIKECQIMKSIAKQRDLFT